VSRKGGRRFDFIEVSHKCATCFLGSIAQNVLLRVVFWASIAQNVLLRVSRFGEVSHKMCSYVYCVLGKYRTKCAVTCIVFGGSIAQNVLLRVL
jgi:hypothetical protein